MKIILIIVSILLLLGLIIFYPTLRTKFNQKPTTERYTQNTLFSKPTAELLTRLLDGETNIDQESMPKGSDVNEVSDTYEKVTPLIYAVLQVNQPAVEALLRLGANPNTRMARNDNAYTLSWTMVGSHPEIMETIIKSGKTDLEALLPDDEPVLYYLAAGGRTELLKLAFEYGASPNISTRGDRYLVMGAAILEEYESVEIILDAGADPNATDNAGTTLTEWVKKGPSQITDPDGEINKQRIKLLERLDKITKDS